MEAEAIVLPDNTIIDTSIPPPGFNFPKPDFTPVVSDGTSEVITDKPEGPLTKPTFKNALQAKKRLQAFSSNRAVALPLSPLTKKIKTSLGNEEKVDETNLIKKAPKRGSYHDEKAKAVIEEIEELKREEKQRLNLRSRTRSRSRSRSRTRSLDKERFKKVDKKSRNYRKRSPTPEKAKKVHVHKKVVKKYPRNWREFVEFDLNFDLNRDFEVTSPKGNNEIIRQLLFESPPLPINQFKMKTVKNEDKNVPFDYIRYTRSKPVIAYSVNFVAIKDKFLSRKVILDSLPKDIVSNIENLYSNSLKFKFDASSVSKIQNWYPKVWKDVDNECKIIEKSVGLSFLQTYTGEEEENDFLEEGSRVAEKKKEKIEEKEKNEEKKEKEIKIEEMKEKEKIEDKKEKSDVKKEEIEVKKKNVSHEKKDEPEAPKKVKTEKEHKKKNKKNEDDKIEESMEKKKKKKRDKRKNSEESVELSDGKKKKNKKSKSKKKEKRPKEKKIKRKKASPEKKKKKQKKEKTNPEQEKVAEKSKQQVLEELKIIEEKLAKKREQDKNKKEEKPDKETSRKRKISEHEDNAKRAKHDRHKKETEHKSETKHEESSKHKSEKEKKVEESEEKSKKHSDRHKKTEENVKKEAEKSKSAEELATKKKKSRWSEAEVKIEDIPFPEKMNLEEEIKRIDEVIKKHEENNREMRVGNIQELVKQLSPDTEEYHSHWESEDDVSSKKRLTLKVNRSWESDEELFERKHNTSKTQAENYESLEIPLNIKNFSRRAKWNEEAPSSYIGTINELKLLEEERRNLNEERRKLEIEKQKILKLQEESKVDTEDKKILPIEEPVKLPSPAPEGDLKIKKEKVEGLDFNLDSLNNSLLSTVSSTESNFPIAVLENQYEEFIKAVSSDSVQTKKKERRSDSDSSWSSSSSESDYKKKKRKKKKKKKKKSGLLLGKGATIFNEFDIPVPSDLPEMVPTPVPVPSPTVLPIAAPNLLVNPIIDVKENSCDSKDPGLDLTKPFVFSSIVLPNKKTPLIDNSILKLNDDSNSADFTDKFVKKGEETKKIEELDHIDVAAEEETPLVEELTKPEEEKIEGKIEETLKEEKKIVELPNIISFPETDSIKEKTDTKMTTPKPKPLPSPEHKPVEKAKKRSRTRSRERELRRRSPSRRRESTPPPSRRRYSSPRRRSPVRRRTPPRRRSPSPRRRSPPRRRRRTPSLSPPRRGGARKRTPSPRIRRASPLNSPLDGFKRSVADSTISDDMLPQPAPEDYNESPNSFGSRYYERKARRVGSLSPQASPRRISLDDRINQVLGLEKNETSKAPETYPSYNYNAYGQYQQYGQYGAHKNEYVTPPFGQPFYRQPPPPMAKPLPPTKVVQVGNILQVVPSEELPQTVIENKPPETAQKIVQVGNMLQIVPAIMPPTKPPIVEPPLPVQPPEIQSAEALMKQKQSERKAEREKRRLERDRRRKEKEKKRKEKERRKQIKLKLKTENMIKRAIQLEAEALACEDIDEEGENAETPVQWPPVPVVISPTPTTGKGILLGDGSSRKRKSVQFADGVRPGEGTSPSGGEELSSPPPHPTKLPKEKRYKKVKIPKKSKKKKIKVKVVKKKVLNAEEDDDDEEDNLPPPSPPPGSPPPHVFPSRVKTHTINNVQQYVGNIIQSNPGGFPFRPPMPVVINRHQPSSAYIPSTYHTDVNNLSHPPYQGVSSHH